MSDRQECLSYKFTPILGQIRLRMQMEQRGLRARHTSLPCLIMFRWKLYTPGFGTIFPRFPWAAFNVVFGGINPNLFETRRMWVSTGRIPPSPRLPPSLKLRWTGRGIFDGSSPLRALHCPTSNEGPSCAKATKGRQASKDRLDFWQFSGWVMQDKNLIIDNELPT